MINIKISSDTSKQLDRLAEQLVKNYGELEVEVCYRISSKRKKLADCRHRFFGHVKNVHKDTTLIFGLPVGRTSTSVELDLLEKSLSNDRKD